MSVVRREAAAEQVRRWGGDRVVIDDDKLESNLAQSLSDTELDIVVDPVGGRAARQLIHHLRFGGTLVSHAVLSGQSASAAVLDLIRPPASVTSSEPAATSQGLSPVSKKPSYQPAAT